MADNVIATVNAGSESNPFPVEIVDNTAKPLPAKKEPMTREQLGLPMPSEGKTTPTLLPKPKGPTAAESLKKQREADKLARLKKSTVGSTTDSTPPVKQKEKKVTATVAKKPAKKAAKPSTNGTPKASKTGLRTMQKRALLVLKDNKNGLPIVEIAKKAKISPVVMQRGIGAINPENRPEHDAVQKFKSLLTLKYVTATKGEFSGKSATLIIPTAKGLDQFKKECPDGKMPAKHASPYDLIKAKPKKKAAAK